MTTTAAIDAAIKQLKRENAQLARRVTDAVAELAAARERRDELRAENKKLRAARDASATTFAEEFDVATDPPEVREYASRGRAVLAAARKSAIEWRTLERRCPDPTRPSLRAWLRANLSLARLAALAADDAAEVRAEELADAPEVEVYRHVSPEAHEAAKLSAVEFEKYRARVPDTSLDLKSWLRANVGARGARLTR